MMSVGVAKPKFMVHGILSGYCLKQLEMVIKNDRWRMGGGWEWKFGVDSWGLIGPYPQPPHTIFSLDSGMEPKEPKMTSK